MVVAVGLEANTQLAETARLETDPEWGGYRVNSELQACTDIWAVSRENLSVHSFLLPSLPPSYFCPASSPFPLLTSFYLSTSPLLSSTLLLPPLFFSSPLLSFLPPLPLLLFPPLLVIPPLLPLFFNRQEMFLATLTPTLVGGGWNIMTMPMSAGDWLEKT